MKKDSVLLVGGNYFPEPTGIGKYNAEMIDWLAAHNYDCGVVTTYPYYPYWKIQDPYAGKSAWYKKEKRNVDEQACITVYRCPHYVPAIPTGIKRMVSDISFFLSAFFQFTRLLFRKKYNYVLVVSPPFQIGLLGYLYKKIKGARLIYHIQDLQIDAAVELGMIKSKYLVRLMFGIERFIIQKADFVSSISDGMIKKIRGKYNRPVILFPNWADTTAFYPILNKVALKEQFNFLPTDKIILYSGAIGEKQGLQALLYTAMELRDAAYIKFIICGSGPYKDRLVDMAGKLALHNVYFMPLQPTEKFNRFLNMADVHLVMQKANENELFMPSKLTTICAVGGLVVVTASENTSLYNLVSTHNLGILIAPEDQSALTGAIKKAIYQDHTIIKRNARKFAADYLSIDKIVANYFSTINPEKVISPFAFENEASLEDNTLPNMYISFNREGIHE
jgi:colanic acid biosynthesis glycosyl transferase WcaI